MKQKISIGLTALSASLLLSACGGGGGTTDSSNQNLSPETPLTFQPTSVTLKQNEQPWFHGYMRLSDKSEVLVLTTMGPDALSFTEPTAVMMLKPEKNGVTDATYDYFQTPPKTYWGRNVVSFNDPITNQPSLLFCNQGREVGNFADAAIPRTNGIWGEQDQLYILENGKFTDKTALIPKSNDFSHGCASASIGDGNRLIIVKNTLGSFDGNPSHYLLTRESDSYKIKPLPSEFAGLAVWWTGAIDLNKSGTDSIILSNAVINYQENTFKLSQTMRAPDLEAQGYSIYHSGAVGDINGDGFPDIIQILSGDGISKPFLSGSMLAVFLNDGKGNLIYSPSAVPRNSPTDFGLDIKIIDINFDGKNDIVTSGAKYGYNNNLNDYKTTAVLLNDGKGAFSLKTISDESLDKNCQASAKQAIECSRKTYFLRGSNDNSYYLFMEAMDSNGRLVIYGREVTTSTPLGIK